MRSFTRLSPRSPRKTSEESECVRMTGTSDKSATRRLLKCLTRRRTRPLDATEVSPARPQIAGLAPDVRVQTDFGPVPISLLRPGDRLKSSDGSWIRLTALRRFGFDADCLEHVPEAQGIYFPAGSLGDGLPTSDVVLAPDQRIEPRRGSAMAAARCAHECVGQAGIRRIEQSEAVYFIPVCQGTGAVLAEGLPVGALAAADTPSDLRAVA